MTSSSSAQHEIPEPPSDAISAVRFVPAPSSSHRLLVSSWDRHVRLYEVAAGGGSRLVRSFEHRAPVLDVCWGGGSNDGDEGEATTVYSVGLDGDVRAINLDTGTQTVLSTHSEPASKVVYSARHSLLISASWDKTLHVHKFNRRRGGGDDDEDGDDGGDENSPKVITIPLSAKPFALGLSPSKLVVAMAGRANSIYDLAALGLFADQDDGTSAVETGGSNTVEAAPWQKRESSLKYMTRAVACMPDDRGYATSSIEGRVAVEWFADDAATQDKKYAFKCHRQAAPVTDSGDEKAAAADIVYPVNVLAFHPQYGTFASGGGDGVVSVWDAAAKKRIRNYAKLGASVAGLDWSADGRWLAIGVSPGFEDGKEFPPGSGELVVKVLVRELADGEAKAKAK